MDPSVAATLPPPRQQLRCAMQCNVPCCAMLCCGRTSLMTSSTTRHSRAYFSKSTEADGGLPSTSRSAVMMTRSTSATEARPATGGCVWPQRRRQRRWRGGGVTISRKSALGRRQQAVGGCEDECQGGWAVVQSAGLGAASGAIPASQGWGAQVPPRLHRPKFGTLCTLPWVSHPGSVRVQGVAHVPRSKSTPLPSFEPPWPPPTPAPSSSSSSDPRASSSNSPDPKR